MCIYRSCFWSTWRFTCQTEKKVTGVGRGTVYTKCVYMVPFSGVPADLSLKLKNVYWCCKRTGVYKMCIHRPVSGVAAELPLKQKKRLLVW